MFFNLLCNFERLNLKNFCCSWNGSHNSNKTYLKSLGPKDSGIKPIIEWNTAHHDQIGNVVLAKNGIQAQKQYVLMYTLHDFLCAQHNSADKLSNVTTSTDVRPCLAQQRWTSKRDDCCTEPPEKMWTFVPGCMWIFLMWWHLTSWSIPQHAAIMASCCLGYVCFGWLKVRKVKNWIASRNQTMG